MWNIAIKNQDSLEHKDNTKFDPSDIKNYYGLVDYRITNKTTWEHI